MSHTRGMTGDVPALDLDSLLNPDEQARFRRLCLTTAAEELREMVEVVDLHVEQIRLQAGDEADTDVDIDAAGRIASSLTRLLAEAGAFDAEQRALIRGALEYFVLADDAAGDLDDALGFDDDARVLNSVLDRVGRPELRVELA